MPRSIKEILESMPHDTSTQIVGDWTIILFEEWSKQFDVSMMWLLEQTHPRNANYEGMNVSTIREMYAVTIRRLHAKLAGITLVRRPA